METLESYYEKQAAEYEGRPLVEVAICPKCGKTKPLSRFKRFLTTGEAKARGLPLRPKTEVETRNCNLCRPARTTPRKDQTNTQLRKSVERGDIPEYVAQKLIEERAQMAIPAMKAGAQARMDNGRRRAWKAILEGVAVEVQALHMQKNYAMRQSPPQQDVVRFCNEYMDVLKDVRSRIKLQARKATYKPQSLDWREYVREYDLNIVRAAWAAVSGTKRKGGIRRPKLFEVVSEVSTVHKYIPTASSIAALKTGKLNADWSDLADMNAQPPEPATAPEPEKPATDWSAIPWEDM